MKTKRSKRSPCKTKRKSQYVTEGTARRRTRINGSAYSVYVTQKEQQVCRAYAFTGEARRHERADAGYGGEPLQRVRQRHRKRVAYRQSRGTRQCFQPYANAAAFR